MFGNAKKDVEVFEHPSQSRVDHHPDDQRLRAANFVIVARPRKGEAVWQRGGELYSHSEALRALKREGSRC